MSTPRITRRQAREAIAYVNKAIRDGAIFHGRPSAVEAGFKLYAADHGAELARGGFQTRVRAALNAYGIKLVVVKPSAVLPKTAVRADLTPEILVRDRKIVGLEDEVRRLSAALKTAHREANVEEIVRTMIGEVIEAPRSPPAWIAEPPARGRGKPDPEVPVTIWADWHLSEVVEPDEVNGFNAFNMAIAAERVERLIDKTIKLAKEHHTGNYPGMVVNLAGDFLSGGLHPELVRTDEEEVLPACIQGMEWLEAGLRRMVDAFGRLYVPCVAGNHGRMTAKPEFKRYYRKNFDWFMYTLLAKRLADDKRIVFDIRPSNDVHYAVYDVKYLLVHGDMLGVKGGDGIIGAIGPIMRGEVKKSGQSSALGMPFDQLLMGHWHQDLWLPRATVANTLKGFDEYARLQLGAKPTRPSQPLWFVHPRNGRTAFWPVYVAPPVPPVNDNWVSVFEKAA
jgi:hypothetical protein